MELEVIEKILSSMIANVIESIESMKAECQSLSADEVNLEAKIEKKKAELERTKKRLESMAHVKPQFMAEYEKLEQDLQALYSVYVGRYRNMEYLEHELDKFVKAEEEVFNEHKRQLETMRVSPLIIIIIIIIIFAVVIVVVAVVASF